jgi:hypothetical protein
MLDTPFSRLKTSREPPERAKESRAANAVMQNVRKGLRFKFSMAI